MFHLAKHLYEEFTQSPEYSILILGLDNAGKTTLLEEFKSLYLPNYKKVPAARILPTVGQNVATITIDGVELKFWDVGGQDALRELWSEYYEHSHGILFVVDSCDTERLVECEHVLSEVVANEKLVGVPVLMLANKQDLSVANKMDIAMLKEFFNPIAEHLNAQDSKVMGISALTGDGVREAVEWMKERVVLNRSNKAPN
ncbi:hypothetical protein CANINC_003553 [Pichia inconspicua]|uniref:ADP-ribosylation factor-like protein 3 n=1 Tax=Pichia inconspicua TaxID=52247 RepID=A0A4T0WYC1_9ASCO|nr:hypothetical protein CANINC_003553 [[Candida] inconspicua]